MSNKTDKAYELISATIPIRCLRSLWNVLTDLKKIKLRDTVFKKYELTKTRLMSDERISLATIKNILCYIETEGISDIGLLTGMSSEYGQFSLFDYFLASSNSINELILYFERYFAVLTTEKSLLKIEYSPEKNIILSLPASTTDRPGDKQFMEMLLGIIIRTITVNSGKAAFLPISISFPYSNLSKNIVMLLTSKAIKIQLNSRSYQLFYTQSSLARQLQYRDSLTIEVLKPVLDKLLSQIQGEKSLTQKVLDILETSDDLSLISQISIADELALSQSSLKRKLQVENTSFSFLLTRFKQSKSMTLVTSTATKLSAITLMLGYKDRTAFERAFKEWFGITPSQIRQQYCLSNLPDNKNNPIDVNNFPASPAVYHKLIQMLDSEKHTVRDIAALIESDPVLSAKILGIANSAYYGYRDVLSISDAITELFGLVQTRNFVLSIMSNAQFDTSLCTEIDLSIFWTHATACYECAKNIVNFMDFKSSVDSERFCQVALLHRLFILVYASSRPDGANQYLKTITDDDVVLNSEQCIEVEQQIFGISGSETTALLLAHWGVPSEIHKIIREMSLDNNKQSKHTRTLLYISDYFRYAIYNNDTVDSKIELIKSMSDTLGFNQKDLQIIFANIENCIAEISEQAGSMY